MPAENEPVQQRLRRALFLASAVAVFSLFVSFFYVSRVPLGAPPDELAHLSYIEDVAESGKWIPNYAESQIINSGDANYLGHPPLYYSIVGGVARIMDWRVPEHYKQMRAVGAAFVSLGLFFLTLAMVLHGWSVERTLIVAAAASAVPMFHYLAAGVNNDNLAYFGVAFVIFALCLRNICLRSWYYLVAAGLVVVMMTKATAAVFSVLFTASWLGLRWRSGENHFLNKHFRFAVAGTAVLVGAYYGSTLFIHGELFPAPGGLYRDRALHGDGMGILSYVSTFITVMWRRLPAVMSHQSYAPLTGYAETVFFAMLVIPVIAWAAWRPLSRAGTKRDLSDAFMLALAGTVMLHMWVGYRGYLETGLLAGIQPRYYAYVLPAVFFFSFLDGKETALKRGLFAAFGLVVAACLALTLPRTAYFLEQARAASIPPYPIAVSGDRNEHIAVGISSAERSGYVDAITWTNGSVLARGWAVDPRSKRPAASIWFVLEGRLLGTAPTGYARPDVARVLSSASAEKAGFKVQISGINPDVPACAVAVFSQRADGTLNPLQNPTCE